MTIANDQAFPNGLQLHHLFQVTMIDHPVCTFIILNNNRIMSRSYPFLPISFQHKFPVVFKHILPVFINIRTKKVFRTPNYHLIRSIYAIATTTNGSKQIIIFTFLYILVPSKASPQTCFFKVGFPSCPNLTVNPSSSNSVT